MSDIIDELWEEVDAELEAMGREAVEVAKENGNYQNRSERLRRSSYYKVENHVLEMGNSAPYASEVSSRGYDVVDSAFAYLRKRVENVD